MKYIKMLLYENNELSLTRTLSMLGWLAFLITTFYLVVTNTHWEDYGIFASYAGGGGTATQVANKLINSRYNSPAGKYTE